MTAINWIRSLVFNITVYLLFAVICTLGIPLALLHKKGAFWVVHCFCRASLWVMPMMTGLRAEIRGKMPEGEYLVASKHQSLLDIIMIASVLDEPRFVMKESLKYAPLLGFYAMRMGCAPVNRGAKGRAVKQIVERTKNTHDDRGQIVIYPQGTRLAPEAKARYKIGAYALYNAHQLPAVFVATNAGVFWPRMAVLRKPGVAVLEILETIPAGMEQAAFMKQMEDSIETASDKLYQEAQQYLR